jgi:hypothetical protein
MITTRWPGAPIGGYGMSATKSRAPRVIVREVKRPKP